MSPRMRTKSPQLDKFPGLGVRPWGTYFIEHPRTRRQASLKTKDEAKAKKLWAIMQQKWEAEAIDDAADALLTKLDSLAEEQQRDIPTVSEFAKNWRTNWLGATVIKQGQVNRYKLGECKVFTQGGARLKTATVKGYANYIYNVFEPSALLQKTKLNDKKLARKLREFLSDWSNKPTTYNHYLGCLSKMMQQAVQDAYIESNPCNDIKPAIIPKKTKEEVEALYIEDGAYAAVTQAMMVSEMYGKQVETPELAHLVDLMLFMSSRPADAFEVLDSDFDSDGHLKYETNKTGEVIWVEDVTGELARTVLWFRQWKKQHRIISPYLCVYPPGRRSNVRGKPIPVSYVSRRFSEAVIEAGYPKGRWTLRLVRHKGLTDEAIKDLTNNKGGHRTESAKARYRVQVIPTRVQNTLANPRDAVKIK